MTKVYCTIDNAVFISLIKQANLL